MRKDIQKIYSKLVLNDTLISYRNVLAYPLNIYGLMESQFAKMRGLTDDYKEEMNFLIFCIKNDLMDSGKCDVKWLYYYLDKINAAYCVMNRILQGNVLFELRSIIEYIGVLEKYSCIYNLSLEDDYFINLVDTIQLNNAKKIIEKQWQDVYNAEDGLKSFIEIFDELFTNCIEKYENIFFHSLSDEDILCRAVCENDMSKASKGTRYIPWDNAGHTNRWNPPGVTFLYLGYDKKIRPYNKEVNLCEYICLLETRSKSGEKHSFCYFKPKKEGKILDLSYNDSTLREAKNILEIYKDTMTRKIVDELLEDPEAVEKYRKNNKLKKAIKKKTNRNPIDIRYIHESLAKQYLIMICSCIYKKVDETKDDALDKAYNSFRILAQYLQKKGVTGIIYPCTRDTTVKGKNLVLFDRNDAIPQEKTIRHIICSEKTFKKE